MGAIVVTVARHSGPMVRFTDLAVGWQKLANVLLLAMTIITFLINADAMYSSDYQSLAAAVLVLNCMPPLIRMVRFKPGNEKVRPIAGTIRTNFVVSGALGLAIAICLFHYP